MKLLEGRWMAALASPYLLVVGLSDAAAQIPEYIVNHTPYLQLGNAALGSPTDQIEILWQTIPHEEELEGDTEDSFHVEYRLSESPTWINAGPIGTIDTDVEERVNHFATITGLQYDTDYEYRVVHERAGAEVATYGDIFHTRLPTGDTSRFTFASYGDSAGLFTIANFRSVQNQINQLDAEEGVAFSLLLGDNVYSRGRHTEFDARLDPSINPELTQYIASHIDYYAMGNHDASFDKGQASRDNYSVPLNGPDEGETPENNYSFDYGNVHFATFDSNSLYDAPRLENQLDWLVGDMQASDATWKIVFVHFPVAGSPDKIESPSDNYYQQVVARLREANVDLFMAGHSHMYHWTYPLLGEVDGNAVAILDQDKDYLKGAGLVQIVSGVSGRSLRFGDFSPYLFDAVGYSRSTDPEVEYGFAQVGVSPNRIIVSYVAAEDGAVIDAFSITADPNEVLLGDLDCDEDVDFDDIGSFVLGIQDPQAYESIFTVPPTLKGDLDRDGDLDFDDIPGFVAAVSSGGGLQSLPEPSSAVLKGLGGLTLLLSGLRYRF